MNKREYVEYIRGQYYNILYPYRELLGEGISPISNGFIDVWEKLGIAIGLSQVEAEWIVECIVEGEVNILEIWLNKNPE